MVLSTHASAIGRVWSIFLKFLMILTKFWPLSPNLKISKTKIVQQAKQNHKVDVMYMIVDFMALIDLIPQLLLMGITLAFVKKIEIAIKRNPN